MKINANVDGKDITIILTKEQLEEIAKQTNCGKILYTDIKGLDDAEKVLENCTSDEHIKYTRKQFPTENSWNGYVLETLVKAVNYIANDYKIWKVNFKDKNQQKWFPYFKLDDQDGFVFYGSNYNVWNVDSAGSFGGCLYLINQEVSDYMGKTFIKQYNT